MLSQEQSFFFVGVAGSGMSAIAEYLAGKGFSISGSDRKFSSADGDALRAQLEMTGVKVFPQDGSGIQKNLSAIVVSSAIEESNPDIKRALELGIPRMHRSEMLAKISESVKTICVSGTSGKSSVTGMIWHILHEAGLYVSAVNPLLIKEYGNNSLRKVKTDKADAIKIAKYALDNWAELRDYTPMDTIRYDLKTLNLQFQLASKQKTATANNLIALQEQSFPGIRKLFD